MPYLLILRIPYHGECNGTKNLNRIERFENRSSRLMNQSGSSVSIRNTLLIIPVLHLGEAEHYLPSWSKNLFKDPVSGLK